MLGGLESVYYTALVTPVGLRADTCVDHDGVRPDRTIPIRPVIEGDEADVLARPSRIEWSLLVKDTTGTTPGAPFHLPCITSCCSVTSAT